jgi:hypothetical protein
MLGRMLKVLGSDTLVVNIAFHLQTCSAKGVNIRDGLEFFLLRRFQGDKSGVVLLLAFVLASCGWMPRLPLTFSTAKGVLPSFFSHIYSFYVCTNGFCLLINYFWGRGRTK